MWKVAVRSAVRTTRRLFTTRAAQAKRNSSVALKPRLDFKSFRGNVKEHELNCLQRNVTQNVNVNIIAALYTESVALQQEIDNLMQAKKQQSAHRGPPSDEQKQAGLQMKLVIQEKKTALNECQAALLEEGLKLPNLTHPDTPRDTDEPAVLREVGVKPVFDGFDARSSDVLTEAHALVDHQSASIVAGRKFYYLSNEGALLELALVNWAMQKLIQKGWTPYIPPDIIRDKYLLGCGFQPRDGNQSQVFHVESDHHSNIDHDNSNGKLLSGTAELQMAGYFSEQVFPEASLPLKAVAFSHSFRTEEGQGGAQSKGLYRVCQFSKVEMFSVCTPEQSQALHNELIETQIEMFEELGLHFQVLDMPVNDLGASAYRKIDLEAWMPGRVVHQGDTPGCYGEISSTSNCTDYQARRLNIRYKPIQSKSKNTYAHTVNGTACAVPRMIISIVEQLQQKDGSVKVPEALVPFMMGIDSIPSNNPAFKRPTSTQIRKLLK